MAMQVLWREAFDGNYPLTVDKFLYCYKPSKISQSIGFYQFSVRGSNCRLIRSFPLYDRRWKTEFFSVSRCWVCDPIKVGKDTFPSYIGEMGRLCSEGMLIILTRLNYFTILV